MMKPALKNPDPLINIWEKITGKIKYLDEISYFLSTKNLNSNNNGNKNKNPNSTNPLFKLFDPSVAFSQPTPLTLLSFTLLIIVLWANE